MTMSNVIRLPDRPVREWKIFESEISRFLLESGATDSEAQHVCMRIRPAFLRLAASNDMGIEVTTGEGAVNAVNAYFHKVTCGLLDELAALALENHRLGGGL